jgi:hypothetical protein
MENERITVENAVDRLYVLMENERITVENAVALRYVLTVAIIDINLNTSLYARNAITTRIHTPSKSATPKSKSEQL